MLQIWETRRLHRSNRRSRALVKRSPLAGNTVYAGVCFAPPKAPLSSAAVAGASNLSVATAPLAPALGERRARRWASSHLPRQARKGGDDTLCSADPEPVSGWSRNVARQDYWCVHSQRPILEGSVLHWNHDPSCLAYRDGSIQPWAPGGHWGHL